jgi:hypothetical protein
VLKSRRVVPQRLLEAGFTFEHPDWDAAAVDLCRRWRQGRGVTSSPASAASPTGLRAAAPAERSS